MVFVCKDIPNKDGYFLIKPIKILENVQQLLCPKIALPAYTKQDKSIHFRSIDLCRHRAKLSDSDALIATVAKLGRDIQRVRPT